MSELPCHPKTRYRTGAEARKALAGIRRRPFEKRDHKPQRAYFCDHCGGHHLTSQSYEQ